MAKMPAKNDRGKFVSEYAPEHCEAVQAHCTEGGSIASFGGTIGVTRQAVYQWRTVHPEFDRACDIALQKALFHSEKTHKDLSDKGAKATGHEFRMKNMAKEFWRERQEVGLNDGEGGPVKYQLIERLIVDPPNPNG